MLREKMTNALGGIGSSINSVAERLGSMGTQRRNLVGGEGNLPTLLRGASAALTGQVPQFRQQLMQEQQFQTAQGLQNLDIKNALATSAAQDSLQIRNMLLMNNDAGAMEILQDRMSLESDLGASSEATQQLMNLVQTDPMQALMNVNAAIGTAIQLGIIDKPDDNLIASSNVITDDSGQRGTVEKDARGNYVFSPIAGTTLEAKDPVTYATVTRDGIPMYTEGPYTGLSVGKVGELMNQGQIQSFGDPIQRQQPAPQQTVRPPLRMSTVPDYSNLSSQEQAILNIEEEDRKREISLKEAAEDRAVAAEDRAVAAEARAVEESEAEAEEAEQRKQLAKNEMLMALGVLQGRLLNPSVYNDDVYAAATGTIEGDQDGPSITTFLPGGASPEQVQDFSDDFKNLNNLLTVGNLGRMTGVLSESDIALIRDAASGLNRTSSPDLLKIRMRAIEKVIVNRLRRTFNMTDQQIKEQLPVFTTTGSDLDAELKEQGIIKG